MPGGTVFAHDLRDQHKDRYCQTTVEYETGTPKSSDKLQ